MVSRKKIYTNIETELLLKSRRRCAICFGLEGDFQVKRGQIAHIDKDRSNSKFDNLVFLCFEHHDEYDSKTSQSKGITSKELFNYKIKLFKYISIWEEKKSLEHYNKKDANLEGYNDFILYKLINPESVSEYEYLAINKNKNRCISLDPSIIDIQDMYWEITQWMNCDYKKTENEFHFELSVLDEFIAKEFNEIDYALLIYYNENNKVYNFTFAFNRGNKYYDVELNLIDNNFEKTTNNGYQRIIQKTNLNTEKDYNFNIFNGIIRHIDKLTELKKILFK